MKKKYKMTLIEIMIVIFIIGIVGSVVGYNMRGSLDKGKAFKTREGIQKIYDIIQLQEISGHLINEGQELQQAVYDVLLSSELVRNINDLMKDGWGHPYRFEIENHTMCIYSDQYEKYCKSKNISNVYPWNANTNSL